MGLSSHCRAVNMTVKNEAVTLLSHCCSGGGDSCMPPLHLGEDFCLLPLSLRAGRGEGSSMTHLGPHQKPASFYNTLCQTCRGLVRHFQFHCTDFVVGSL
jgi:hypothetical protein